MRLFSSMVSAGLLVFSAASANAAQLIVNGGFESGNFTPSLTDPTYDVITQGGPQDLTGWTVGNSLVWGVNTTDINTHTGTGFVDLTGIGDTVPHGELNQTISTIAGQQYNFSVFLTQDFSSSIVGIDVFANGVALALLGTPGIWNYQPTGATYGQMTGSFIASAPSTQISIRSILFGSRVFMIGLDDVSVTGPAASPVPLPGTLPFLASAIAGLGLVGWRKRRKAKGTTA